MQAAFLACAGAVLVCLHNPGTPVCFFEPWPDVWQKNAFCSKGN